MMMNRCLRKYFVYNLHRNKITILTASCFPAHLAPIKYAEYAGQRLTFTMPAAGAQHGPLLNSSAVAVQRLAENTRPCTATTSEDSA